MYIVDDKTLNSNCITPYYSISGIVLVIITNYDTSSAVGRSVFLNILI